MSMDFSSTGRGGEVSRKPMKDARFVLPQMLYSPERNSMSEPAKTGCVRPLFPVDGGSGSRRKLHGVKVANESSMQRGNPLILKTYHSAIRIMPLALMLICMMLSSTRAHA